MHKLLGEYDVALGKRIRDYRVTHDIPQEKLAKYLNLPKQAISRIENGKRRMTTEELEKTALFFDEPMAMFIRKDFKYTYPSDTVYGALPVFMSDFLNKYRYAYENLGDVYFKEGKKYDKILFSALKSIPGEVKQHKDFKYKQWKEHERNNLH